VKGLKDRFFATLRMTVPNEYIVKCTNVMHSGLARRVSLQVGVILVYRLEQFGAVTLE
jgi:hypothetical protein